jgi:hypothetical protein
MAQEFDAWLQHTNRWQITPPWPILAIWFCPDFGQFQKLRVQIEAETLTRGYRWVDDEHKYIWPNGSQLFVVSCDRNWKYAQGTNPDLVGFDEEPPMKLWTELMMRRRGTRDTRYLVAATATQGMTWMHGLIYKPWLDAHGGDAARGRSEQKHPDTWVWDRGGIDDNPGATVEQRAWYHSRVFGSEKERRVRLFGGFADWVGDSVFRDEDLEHLRRRVVELEDQLGPGADGFFAPKEAA